MISSKSLKYTVRILLGILLGVYLGIIVLLNIPYVQDKLSYIVTKELRKVLNTEVSVGKIDMGLLNRIIVEDVLLEDRRGREMLKVARLCSAFRLFGQYGAGNASVSSQLSICSGCFCFQRHGEDSDKSEFTHQLFIDKTRTYHIRCLVGARNPRTVQYRPSCRKELRSHRFAEGAPQRLAERLHTSSEL